jgi:hypothetical protein
MPIEWRTPNMSRNLIAALAFCSLFIGASAMAGDHHRGHSMHMHMGMVHHPRGHGHSHGGHHSTGRRSHGH